MQNQGLPLIEIGFLPNEILAYIFAVGSLYSAGSKPSLVGKQFQELASHVCHHWRAVTLSSPLLWTSLYIQERTSTERIYAWLERSRKSILYIDLFIDGGPTQRPEANDDDLPIEVRIVTIMDTLCHHHERWGTLIVTTRYISHLQLITNHFRNCENPRSLENLELEHIEGTFFWILNFYRVSETQLVPPQQYTPQVFFPSGAPLLKRVSLAALPVHWNFTPWLRNLTEIEIAYYTATHTPTFLELITIIRSSPYLEVLKLHTLSIPEENNMEHFDLIPLKSLRVLHLSFEDETLPCHLLESLEMDNLVSLSLSCATGHCDQLMTMLLTSSKSPHSILKRLRQLHLNGISLASVPPQSIFTALTDLQELDLQKTASVWLAPLVESSTKVVYMKQLQRLTVIGAPGHQICDFVRKRILDHCPIRSLIYQADDLQDAQVRWLEAELDFCEDLYRTTELIIEI